MLNVEIGDQNEAWEWAERGCGRGLVLGETARDSNEIRKRTRDTGMGEASNDSNLSAIRPLEAKGMRVSII